MAAWQKSSPGLVALFETAVPARHDIERRKMFGYPAAFANGYLFAGLHQESFILKLDEADRAKLSKEHGARPFEPMPGRRMGAFMTLTDAILADRSALKRWIACAHTYVMSLPPKAAKATKAKLRARKAAR